MRPRARNPRRTTRAEPARNADAHDVRNPRVLFILLVVVVVAVAAVVVVACHAKAAEPKGHRRDARAYIRPLGSAHCPTPATQKQRSPRDTRGTPGRTSDPLPVHIVPRLPRKSSGAQGTPEGHQHVHPTPWQCTLSHACHAKAAEPKGHRRDARAYIRPLGSAHCPTPATQKRRSPRDTRGTPGRTSDPLPVHIVPRLPRKSSGAQGTPEGRQGVHPTPCQCTLSHACHAKAAEPKGHQRDARAYIRPLASAHCPTPATQKRRSPRDTGGTPGRTSDPLPLHIVPRLPRKSGGVQGTPEGRQGVHPTPWQCTLPHACHAKAAEPKGHRRDTSMYIRPLGSAHCPTYKIYIYIYIYMYQPSCAAMASVSDNIVCMRYWQEKQTPTEFRRRFKNDDASLR